MDVITTTVERSSQGEQHHDPVSPAAMAASRTTPTMAPFTNTDWSARGLILQIRWQRRLDARERRPDSRDDVERTRALRLEDRKQRPLCRSSGPCSSAARNRRARAPRRADRPSPIDLLDRKIVERGTTSGLPFMMIGYSSDPIFAVPLGRITFC